MTWANALGLTQREDALQGGGGDLAVFRSGIGADRRVEGHAPEIG